jgi:hypothetical protein
MQEMIKLLKMFTLTMERKYFVESIAPLINANVVNSIEFLQRMGLLERTVLYTHCNWSMT